MRGIILLLIVFLFTIQGDLNVVSNEIKNHINQFFEEKMKIDFSKNINVLINVCNNMTNILIGNGITDLTVMTTLYKIEPKLKNSVIFKSLFFPIFMLEYNKKMIISNVDDLFDYQHLL